MFIIEQNLEKVQKEFSEQKLDLDESRKKLELAEKYNNELSDNLERLKNETHKHQQSIKR